MTAAREGRDGAPAPADLTRLRLLHSKESMSQPTLARQLTLSGLVATGVCSKIGVAINSIPFTMQRTVPEIGPNVLLAFALAAVPAERRSTVLPGMIVDLERSELDAIVPAGERRLGAPEWCVGNTIKLFATSELGWHQKHRTAKPGPNTGYSDRCQGEADKSVAHRETQSERQ